MRFVERKEWLFDPAVFKKSDTQTALRIYNEYVKKFSANPPPRFLEVDRATSRYDDLWHFPLDDRTHFSRVLDIPAINQFERPDWRLTKVGLVPQRKDNFYISNLLLQEFDYFPQRGDMVSWNGYRYMIIKVSLEPNGYWQQTNVWLGLVVECAIPAEGDARPLIDVNTAVPAEVSSPRPLPEA